MTIRPVLAPVTLPVTIVTGFLGSGKTTLLNRLLREPNLAGALVIVNEFGEVGIDHLLVEQAGEDIIELSDGCLCCTMRGDLLDTLIQVLEQVELGAVKKISRIIIETTGLADPVPVLQLLMAHPRLMAAIHIENVITVIDAINGMKTLDKYHEAIKQVAVADCLVITKGELGRTHDNKILCERVRKLNPHAEMLVMEGENTSLAPVFEVKFYDRNPNIDIHQEHVHHHEHHHDPHQPHHHGEGIRSFSLTHHEPFPRAYVDIFIDLLCANYGSKILRMKGIVATVENGNRPLVVHGAQGLFHPPFRLENWHHSSEPATRLVVIADGVDESEILSLFDAITHRPTIDRPDLAALTQNPLTIPGMKL